MTDESLATSLWIVLLWLAHVAFMARAVLRRHRDPSSRLAWVVVIAVFPLVGIVAYLLLGETSIGRRRALALRKALAQLPRQGAFALPPSLPGAADADSGPPRSRLPERYQPLFALGSLRNGMAAVGGNQGRLMADSNTTIEAMVADIDAATDHVHLLFYIWLNDGNGLKIAAALMRAARRGVSCRAMADGLGSRAMIASKHWSALRESGVLVATALPVGNPLVRAWRGRIDLRNHRKIVVIDQRITYCGSQNCADPEFRVKPRFAPWVDVMIRFDGPIAWQNLRLFASDWMAQVDEDLGVLLRQPCVAANGLVTAQVIGSGPSAGYSAIAELFATLFFAARRELFITTPYYVPDESMQAALCASARRGVAVTIIFPERNDSWIVGAASRSYYADLLAAGVRIFEYRGGLLHSKTVTLDDEIALIGSANMDRRSFDLNFENNILFHDPALTAELRARQQDYLAHSIEITGDRVKCWPLARNLLNNTVAMFGPLL
jgi:cardiolipin synthase